VRASELAKWLGAELEGDGTIEIIDVADVEAAGPLDVTFAAGAKAAEKVASSSAACFLVTPDFRNTEERTVIRVPDPRAAFARTIRLFHPEPMIEPGIHPTAVIDPEAEIGQRVKIGPCASIGKGSRIGDNTVIGPGCAIDNDVVIGERCTLHANVTVYSGVEIGPRSIIHSGVVLGADGFGFVPAGDHLEKFPQIGGVRIGADVEIGAQCTVDRGALGTTEIGDGTKLDNMVHVGHNCRLGKHILVVAQTGFSGGVEVGDWAVIGGQVGIGDKVRIESRAVLGSGCGVLTSKIVRSGQVLWGTPARPLKEYLVQLAHLARLPKLKKEVTRLEKRIAAAEEKLKDK